MVGGGGGGGGGKASARKMRGEAGRFRPRGSEAAVGILEIRPLNRWLMAQVKQ